MLFIPENRLDLHLFLKSFKEKKLINIIGGCSNLLVRDGGVKGVIVKLGSGFDFINFDSDHNIIFS